MNSKITLLLFSIIFLLSACQPEVAADTPTIKAGMFKVSILYPSGEGHSFDMDYYANQHMPMVAELFGDALKAYGIEQGVSGRTPDDPLAYLAMGHFYFDELADYNDSFGPNAEQILGDIPNYTNIQPLVQISEVIY